MLLRWRVDNLRGGYTRVGGGPVVVYSDREGHGCRGGIEKRGEGRARETEREGVREREREKMRERVRDGERVLTPVPLGLGSSQYRWDLALRGSQYFPNRVYYKLQESVLSVVVVPPFYISRHPAKSHPKYYNRERYLSLVIITCRYA